MHISDSLADCYDEEENLFFEWAFLSPCTRPDSGKHSHFYAEAKQEKAHRRSKSTSKSDIASGSYYLDEGFDARGNSQGYVEQFIPTVSGYPPLEWVQCISHHRPGLMVTIDYLNENLDLFGRVRFIDGKLTHEAHWTDFAWIQDYHQLRDEQGILL